MIRLEIDRTRCAGHGLCAALLPGVIALDEWGFPMLDAGTGGSSRTELRRVVAACPALALRLERDAGRRDTGRRDPEPARPRSTTHRTT